MTDMAIEATFTIPQDDFPLSAVFEQMQHASIELDRVVPTENAVIPYFWIYADDTAHLTTDLSDDIGVNQVRIIDELEEQMLIRIEWNLDHESVLTAIVNTDVTLLAGIGAEEGWTFEVRAGDHHELSAFRSYCQDQDIPIQLTELHALSSLQADQEYDLTEGQREALMLGYTHGYFDSPRTASQDEIADELGISRQAVSSRLQRGIRRLISDTLITGES